MKFTVASNEILQHLQAVARVISPKSTMTMPILGNIQFELKGNELTLTAADMGNRITTKLEVNNQGEDGAFTVLERMILEAIKELPDQPITFDINIKSKEASITYNNGLYSLVVESNETFPIAKELKPTAEKTVIDPKALLDGLLSTLFASSTDERRPIMTGVYMDFYEDKLVFVASDGRILVKHTNNNIKSPTHTSFSLSKKACMLLTRTLLPKEDKEVKVSYDYEYVHFELSGFTLTSRLLEGRYPNYNSVIPENNPFHIVVDKQLLLSASKRVAVFSNQASNMVRLEIHDNDIKLSANDIDFSVAAEEHVPCQCVEEDINIRIGFDSNMLQTILQNITSEEVTICLADQTRAGIIYPNENEDGIELCNLIIPMKLIGE